MGTQSTIQYTMQGKVCKNSMLSHTKCRSEHHLLMLLCCSELTNHMHPRTGQHVTFTLLCNWIGFSHGQILIETATHSLFHQQLLIKISHLFGITCIADTDCDIRMWTGFCEQGAYGPNALFLVGQSIHILTLL